MGKSNSGISVGVRISTRATHIVTRCASMRRGTGTRVTLNHFSSHPIASTTTQSSFSIVFLATFERMHPARGDCAVDAPRVIVPAAPAPKRCGASRTTPPGRVWSRSPRTRSADGLLGGHCPPLPPFPPLPFPPTHLRHLVPHQRTRCLICVACPLCSRSSSTT